MTGVHSRSPVHVNIQLVLSIMMVTSLSYINWPIFSSTKEWKRTIQIYWLTATILETDISQGVSCTFTKRKEAFRDHWIKREYYETFRLYHNTADANQVLQSFSMIVTEVPLKKMLESLTESSVKFSVNCSSISRWLSSKIVTFTH